MTVFLDIFASTVQLMLTVISYSMLGRALMPLFIDVEDSRFYLMLCVITEPLIIPVRAVMAHFNVGQDSPIDLAFSLTYIILTMIQLFLPAI